MLIRRVNNLKQKMEAMIYSRMFSDVSLINMQ